MTVLFLSFVSFFFFFNDTATTEIYTLSLHDALPIDPTQLRLVLPIRMRPHGGRAWIRSEEHTSELQSRQYLVCRLLLENKKNLLPQTRVTAITKATQPGSTQMILR